MSTYAQSTNILLTEKIIMLMDKILFKECETLRIKEKKCHARRKTETPLHIDLLVKLSINVLHTSNSFDAICLSILMLNDQRNEEKKKKCVSTMTHEHNTEWNAILFYFPHTSRRFFKRH